MSHPELGEGTVEWLSTWYKTVLHTDASGGVISVTDTIGPAGSGPPRHVHDDADETFVMLTGQAEFWLDGTLLQRRAGETVFVPRGKEHTFRVTGTEPSRHLVIMTPGGFEGFFAEMADAASRKIWTRSSRSLPATTCALLDRRSTRHRLAENPKAA